MNAVLRRLEWWGARPFISLAVFFALSALVSADLGQVEVSAVLFLIALAFAFGSFIGWTYRRLPEGERAAAFSHGFVGTAAAVSLVVSAAFSSAYWFLGWKVDLHLLPQFILRHYRDFDFIPSTFALLLPIAWRSGFHQFYRSGTYCFPGPFWWESMRYLRTAIPAYTLVFFTAACAGRLIATSMSSRPE